MSVQATKTENNTLCAPAHCGLKTDVVLSQGFPPNGVIQDWSDWRRLVRGATWHWPLPAVWGVADSPASVREAFFRDYLASLGLPAPEPFIIWNLLSVGTPEEGRLVRAIQETALRAGKAGFHVQSFAIDDPWADTASLWQPDPLRFPKGFAPLTEALNQVDSRLGLWLSLSGHTLDTRWGALEGLEVTQRGYRGPTSGRYCQAGPKYRAAVKGVLERYMTDHKVNYFKCDYNSFGCDETAHGHAAGSAGCEAQIDGFIDILRHIRAIDPECRIAITSGMWLSPWWTLYADYVWLGGNDGDVAKNVRNLTDQDGAITYRDGVMYDDFVVNQYVFPFTALMTHGFWEQGDAPFAKFQDDVMMTVGRGITKWEILNSPASMDDKRFAFLGRVFRWARTNWGILSDTRMVLGDPRKGEVYGYSHASPEMALVFLRNPDVESKALNLSLDDLRLTGKLPAEALSLKAYEVYPAFTETDWTGAPAAPIPVLLLGSQVKVLAIASDASLAERHSRAMHCPPTPP